MQNIAQVDILSPKIKEGDIGAFEELYKTMSSRIYKFAYSFVVCKEDAEEIMNDVFLKLWNSRNTIDEHKSLQSFLFTITRNATLDKLRKYSAEHVNLTAYFLDSPTEEYNPVENHIFSEELNGLVTSLINEMPPQRKRIFELNRFEGMSQRAISDYLNLSQGTVEKQISKALNFLKHELQKRSIPVSSIVLATGLLF